LGEKPKNGGYRENKKIKATIKVEETLSILPLNKIETNNFPLEHNLSTINNKNPNLDLEVLISKIRLS
jgi:hypothetical protein